VQESQKVGHLQQWLALQSEAVRDVIDPTWSVIRAGVVLASRNLQAELADLEAWHERTMTVSVGFYLPGDPDVLIRTVAHGTLTVGFASTASSSAELDEFFSDLSRSLRRLADTVDRTTELNRSLREGLH